MAVILSYRFKKIIVDVVCLLYILLFVYAAVSKILDFENFQVQLGQSPLLSASAILISYAIIGLELLVSIFLTIPMLKKTGLFLSFFLMLSFIAYITIILNNSSFIPCSCGGILEKMGWGEHLIFNYIFALLALLAILLQNRKTKSYLTLISGSILTISGVIILNIISERKLHHENPFIRRFDKNALMKKGQIELKHHNYYFAGAASGKIYFGNHNAPLELLEYDLKTKIQVLHHITIDNDSYRFLSVNIRIYFPFFYVFDGTVPVVYRGKINIWKAKQIFKGDYYFSRALPVADSSVFFRAQDRRSKENILGIFFLGNKNKVSLHDKLLEKQIDGVFDTDGTITYDPNLKRIIYTYYYRNQFIVMSDNLKLIYRGKTIDTISKATLRITYFNDNHRSKPAVPAVPINKLSTAAGGRLYINSTLRGKLEPLKLWKTASFIDIYDLEKNSYITSLYVKDVKENKVNDMIAFDDYLLVLLDKTLIYYQINNKLK